MSWRYTEATAERHSNSHTDLDTLALEALGVQFIDTGHDVGGVFRVLSKFWTVPLRNDAFAKRAWSSVRTDWMDGLDNLHYIERIDVIHVLERNRHAVKQL